MFRQRMCNDIKQAMKATYTSKCVILSSFMPYHMFVHIFRNSNVRKTPTMWVCKEGLSDALTNFLPQAWHTKEGPHNDDIIRCEVVCEKMVSQFVFSKQQFTLSFPYKRWKFTRPTWELLDSDVGVTNDLDINYEFHGETKMIMVCEDCSMSHLRA